MQFFQPKVIEKETDLLCMQHQQQIQYIILDSQLSRSQRHLCKSCGQENPQKTQIVDYQYLKQTFEKQQRERIQQYQPMIKPHIECVESFYKIIDALKTRLIQQLDYLLWSSKNWITDLIHSVVQSSFFRELDKLIQCQMSIINPTKIIDNQCNLKINPKLDQYKLFPEFKKCQEMFQQLNNLTQTQEIEIKVQQIQQDDFVYEKKEDLYEILNSLKDLDVQIFNVKLEILKKENISDIQGFLLRADTQQHFNVNNQERQNFINVIRNINEHEFNRNDYSSDKYFNTKLCLIKKIRDDKNIIVLLKFIVNLTAIDSKFIQCGSNSLNLLVEMKADLKNHNFENIRIKKTSLIGSNFVRCNLNGSEFENVNISGMNVNQAQLFNCKWKNIKIHELNKLDGHSDTVYSVCFSPDGNTLASGSDDKFIHLWDVKTGQQKSKLNGHSERVWSVCFSPNGNTLASDNGHSNTVYSVCFLPDGNILASGSADKSIRLWDVKTEQQKFKLDGHDEFVMSVCFSPDGNTLASGSNDNSIRLWHFKTGKEIQSTDKSYKDILAQFKTPLFQNNPHLENISSNISISQQPIFQAKGALILKGEFVNQSGIDLKTLFIQKGSCILENQDELPEK